jgi:hypothetical protein
VPSLNAHRPIAIAVFVVTLVGASGCGGGDPSTHVVAGEEAQPTADATAYPPNSWMAKLDPPLAGDAVPVACFDANRDQRINGADAPDLAGLDIVLTDPAGCLPPMPRREWFAVDPPDLSCRAGVPRPLLIVAIGGGGTDLLDTNEGVSAGLIDVVNGVRAATADTQRPTGVFLTTAAIKAADMPQKRMEEWLTHDLVHRLGESPCLRAVLIGHSHGAVIATTLLAALEGQYADRLYGVLLDRSLLYYDHPADEFPLRAPVLNVYQTNEGWHGEPLTSTNVINFDDSSDVAPREPREGPEPIVSVAHSTLDDAQGARAAIIEHVIAWLGGN